MTKKINSDILVIGGGLSGCMAAINASIHGARVAVMEKSHIERSGAAGTGNDHFWFYDPEIHEPRGWTVPDMVRDISTDGEYGKTKGGLMDQELLEIVAKGTKEAVDRLEGWGVQFRYDKVYPWNLRYDAPEGEKMYRIVPQFQSEWDTLNYDGRDIKKRLAEQCLKHGVEVYNRVAGTGLLTNKGKVVGATGVHMRTGKFHVFQAKAVIMATGMDQWRLFKPNSGHWFNSQSPPYITGDGEAMAIRAGAEVFILQAGKSQHHGFQYWRNICRSSPAATTCYPAGRLVNSEREVMIRHPAVREPMRKYRQKVEDSVAEGKTPFYLDWTEASEEEVEYALWSYGNEGLCWGLLEIMKDLGIDFRTHMIELELEEPGRNSGGFLAPFIDIDCKTSLEGLFVCSPVQFTGEVAAPTYTVLGWRAGEKAAEYIKAWLEPVLDDAQVEAEEERVLYPLNADEGHTWQEVNLELNQVMEEYKKYVAGTHPPGKKDVISTSGLRNTLEMLQELASVKMKASDPHELVRCNEVMNLIDVGVLMVQAAFEPDQYKQGCWFLGRVEGGRPVFRSVPIKVKYPPREVA
ncbi:MAG: FAD-dependent oxidoreductase [Candidatus Bathyarchaeota archaeon]